MPKFAINEVAKIGILKPEEVRGLVRVPRAEDVSGVLRHVRALRRDRALHGTAIENLFLVGRNGMHKYNNQDHSMLTAMVAVDNIVNGIAEQAEPVGGQHGAGIPRTEVDAGWG